MPPNQNQRPQFFEGQYLGADDLQALIAAGRMADARHDLGAHTWGIASGLQLIERDRSGGLDVYVTPGYAWDGFGRPVVVLAPYQIPADLFKGLAYDAATDGANGRLVKVWIEYDEIKSQLPAPGYETCGDDGFSRVQETFRLEIGERSFNDHQSPITVGPVSALAQEIPARLGTTPLVLYDGSIPFQQLPSEGSVPRWLIPLGHVRWKPNLNALLPGAFGKRDDPDELTSSRRLRWSIGVVSETIRPVEDVVRIRGRGQDPKPKRWSADLAWVEGDLRVDGKVSLCDATVGNLKWQIDGTTANLTIGEANVAGALDARLYIKSAGNVGIGTTTPTNKLHVDGNSGIRQNRLYLSGKEGWSSLSYNAHRDEAGGAWVFPDTSRPAVTMEMDDVGGNPRWSVYNTRPGDTQTWMRRFHIDGISGNLLLAESTGCVGIGTVSPTQLLTLGGDAGTRLEIARTSATMPWGSTAGTNPGSFVINQQSSGSGNAGADFALARDKKLRVVLGDTDTFFSSQNGALRFFINRSEPQELEAMHIDNTGKVGIGTVTPGAQLEVNGNINYGQLNKLDVADQFSAYLRAADLLLGHSTRRGAPGRALVDWTDTLVINFENDWSGTLINGSVSFGSSKTLKKNVSDFPCAEARNILNALAPVKFCFTSDRTNKNQIGFIAEDVPEIVATPDRKGVSPMNIIGVLVQVVKEHQKAIGMLQKTVASLEGKLKKRTA